MRSLSRGATTEDGLDACSRFGIGPVLAGPTSEVAGRRPVYLISYGIFAACSWGAAYAPNYAALVIFRLLAGMSGSSSLNNHGASVADVSGQLQYCGQAQNQLIP